MNAEVRNCKRRGREFKPGVLMLVFETHKFYEKKSEQDLTFSGCSLSSVVQVRLRLGRSSLLRRLDGPNPSSIPGGNLAIFFADPAHKF